MEAGETTARRLMGMSAFHPLRTFDTTLKMVE